MLLGKEMFCAEKVKGILLFKPGLRLVPWPVCLGTAGFDPALRGVKKAPPVKGKRQTYKEVFNAPEFLITLQSV